MLIEETSMEFLLKIIGELSFSYVVGHTEPEAVSFLYFWNTLSILYKTQQPKNLLVS